MQSAQSAPPVCCAQSSVAQKSAARPVGSLAVTGVFRFAFPVWAGLVLVQLVRWVFLSSYQFSGKDEFSSAIWLTVGALGAFLSALQLFKSKERLRAERGRLGRVPLRSKTAQAV